MPYRVPGRELPAEIPPPPGRRVLLTPVRYAASCVGVCLGMISLWNLAGWIFMKPNERFVPLVERLEDGVMIGIAASLLVAIGALAVRVVPQWRGLRTSRKVVYVLGLLIGQLLLVASAEVAAIYARGGIHLFEPHHVGTVMGSNGKSAHVYKDSFLTCRYEIYVSGVLSPTMTKSETSVTRASCQEPTPTAKWSADGQRVDLVDAAGNKLESQSTPGGFGNLFGIFAGGC